MAGDKLEDKIYSMSKKLIDYKCIKRGVKEVGKAIRKNAKGLVVFAADVSPVDVLSHIPVQCEKKELPYIFVRSRLQLGLNSDTKRPTSVIMMTFPQDETKIGKKLKKIYKKVKESLYA